MNTHHRLASRFQYGSPELRSNVPLTDDQIRRVAPSIFAQGAHDSRSARYTYIPTSTVLAGLRKEGFEPFMVTQTRVRDEGKREHTKHLMRLRHRSQFEDTEAAEVLVLNSHDGTSAYQALSGLFTFVCKNSLVCGEKLGEVRVPHKGSVVNAVIQGAHDILDGFDLVREHRNAMRSVIASTGEAQAFARAALMLKYEPDPVKPPPITETQLLQPRRAADAGSDLWSVFSRVQEGIIAGGLSGRSVNGRRQTTRAVTGIDQNVKLNRALWTLAEEFRRLKSFS